MLGSKECARVGWEDEPVEFSAYKNYDCDIQVWAYRSALIAEVAISYVHVRLEITHPTTPHVRTDSTH